MLRVSFHFFFPWVNKAKSILLIKTLTCCLPQSLTCVDATFPLTVFSYELLPVFSKEFGLPPPETA